MVIEMSCQRSPSSGEPHFSANVGLMGTGKWLCLALCVTVALSAQQKLDPDEFQAHTGPYVPPPPPNTLRSEVKLVEVPVVVRDGKHKAIAGLKQSDFQVFDQGKEQTITTFSVESLPASAAPVAAETPDAKPNQPAVAAPAPPAETQHPRFIALCLDNLSTPFADLRHTKTAAEKFVRTGLASGDRVAVFTTASTEQTVTFTDEVSKLVESIEKVTPQPRFSDRDGPQCPRITAYQAYLIHNHMDNDTLEGVVQEDMACKHIKHDEALQEANSLANMIWEHSLSNSRNALYSIEGIVNALGKLPGRRMLLLASSGFLSGNLEYVLEDMTTKALHAEVVINALDSKGLYALTPGRPIDEPPVRGRSQKTQIAEASIQSRQESAKDDGMAILALGTGGALYHNSNDLDKGFHELGTIPDVVYVLGFSPSDATPDGRFHVLKVKLAPGNHYSLQSRLGYTAPTKTPPPEQRQPSKLDTEALASDTLAEVPVMFGSKPGNSENGNPALTAVLHLDLNRLKFDTSTDRHALKLKFVIAMLNATGAYVAGTQGEIELALKQASFDALVGQGGMNVLLPVHAPPGTYTLRGVVQESLDGKMSASSMPVEMR
jgi:VWFA-related protein